MHSTCGIILKREDFRERDERVTLYTRDFGKISVIAKGLKRIEAKLRGNLDIFNFVDIIFVEGVNFYILTGVDLKSNFSSITKDSSVYSAALSAAQAVSYIFEERAKDKDFFDALCFTIKKLNEYASGNPSRASLYSWLLLKKFQMVILENQGYKVNKESLSKNSELLFQMLKGSSHSSVSLSKQDFLNIEDSFTRSFEYFFSAGGGSAFGGNFKFSSWIPSTEEK